MTPINQQPQAILESYQTFLHVGDRREGLPLYRLGGGHGGVELEQVVHRLPAANHRLLFRDHLQRGTGATIHIWCQQWKGRERSLGLGRF